MPNQEPQVSSSRNDHICTRRVEEAEIAELTNQSGLAAHSPPIALSESGLYEPRVYAFGFLSSSQSHSLGAPGDRSATIRVEAAGIALMLFLWRIGPGGAHCRSRRSGVHDIAQLHRIFIYDIFMQRGRSLKFAM
ncbi:uncharacterized protein MCYG_05775 [Microsporum canis CBS 113480]|uniref:Uncharacterized protein n=1 Tax=Arthroderma otae (strain ATCC MYA-4605 / CBS 113480) TaxID=554155 RepID=C5FSV3_ARTOC|nr:uncharacterized protein MCYG_05775 [Microsporum canis CBS 113480]EEQ32956.1 predicted protein [Microsporum canis CBS 113480]